MTDTIAARKTPLQMLAAYDRFISGLSINADEKAMSLAVARAACFAAEAYERGVDANSGAHSLARAFLCALIDPLRPDLDYLRANPASGQIERDKMEARNDH